MHLLTLLLAIFALASIGQSESRPNILWIVFEDISRDLRCYGDKYSISPNIDALAKEGILYTRAWSNAGMCAPARATLITGMYPPSTGAQNMRSEVTLPPHIQGYPDYLREAGYFCSNHVKHDYNWVAPKTMWDGNDADWKTKSWDLRTPGQPFFTVINITDTHSSQLYYRGEERYQKRLEVLSEKEMHDPQRVRVPPYYPDTMGVRKDLARYYDNITYADKLVGDVLTKLEADGLADDTIVFFYSDHGRGMPRSKGWLFQSSLRVPLILRFPEKYAHLAPSKPGSESNRMVSFVDFAPTVLSLAGVTVPDHMQGKAFLGEQEAAPRELAFAYRDRMDERIDLIRAVWDGRYKYIRNFRPHLPWFHHQTRNYPHKQNSYQILHTYWKDGLLNPSQSVYMTQTRPREQLFDTKADPHELTNLAECKEHEEILKWMRGRLSDWQRDILDLGFMPENQWWNRFGVDGNHLDRHTLVRENSEFYPYNEIKQAANLVGAGKESLSKQIELLSHYDPAVRHWAIEGIIAQKEDGRPALPALRKVLNDDVSGNRIAAAQALCALGETRGNLQRLVDALYTDKPILALPAANALDHLGEIARPVFPQIENYLGVVPDQSILGWQFPYRLLEMTMDKF